MLKEKKEHIGELNKRGERSPSYKKRSIKKCLTCDKEFMVRPCEKGRKYCSQSCYGKHLSTLTGKKSRLYGEKITKKCLTCGKEFKVSPNEKDRKYCSKRCFADYLSTLTGEKSPRYKKRAIQKCEICNTEFKVKPGEKNRRFCSNGCFGKWRSENKRGVSLYNYNKKIKKCATCGKEYKVSPSRINSKYCSRRCLWDHTATLVGEFAPAWKGGEDSDNKRKTPEYKRWRQDVFGRDDFTCVCCEKRGVELHAHHLTNFADLYNEADYVLHNVGNGITFCKKCHRGFHNIYGRLNNNDDQVWEFVSNFCLS